MSVARPGTSSFAGEFAKGELREGQVTGSSVSGFPFAVDEQANRGKLETVYPSASAAIPALNDTSPEPEVRSSVVLRRTDQVCIALILLVCAAIFVIHIAVEINARSGLVHIDRVASAVAAGEPGDALEHNTFRISYEVDVNAAAWPELENLPGVGEVTARAIVSYRATHGPFSSPEDLLDVPGIGPKTLEKLMPYLHFQHHDPTTQ